MTKKREWRSFEEARDFVRTLRLRNVREWQEYCKSGNKPNDIPVSPRQVYSSKFKGFRDWFGTGVVHQRDRRYRSFTEARQFVRKLGLKNQREWRAYCRSGKKPNDIPSDPARIYSSEHKGMGDWLGTGHVHPRARQYRPFEKAREYVQGLGLKNQSEWRAYCKSGEKPKDIPSSPLYVYGSEFEGYGDWLGTANVANRDREFRPFEEAREFARSLKLKSQREWRDYSRSGEKPHDIPSNPDKTYLSEFRGYGDWLGTGSVRAQDRQWRPFEQAREFVRKLELKNVAEWWDYCRSGVKPQDIPSNPNRVYSREFKGYTDWLGTGLVHPRPSQYRAFHDV